MESLGPYQQNTEVAVGGCGADIGQNAGAPAVGSDTVEAFRLGSLVAPPSWEGFDFVLSHLTGVCALRPGRSEEPFMSRPPQDAGQCCRAERPEHSFRKSVRAASVDVAGCEGSNPGLDPRRNRGKPARSQVVTRVMRIRRCPGGTSTSPCSRQTGLDLSARLVPGPSSVVSEGLGADTGTSSGTDRRGAHMLGPSVPQGMAVVMAPTPRIA